MVSEIRQRTSAPPHPNQPAQECPVATKFAALTIAIVIPAYNEETSIAETIRDYKKHFSFARIIVVDNASTDATYENALSELDSAQDLLLREPVRGKGNAMRAAVSRIDADVFVFTDADLTYPSSEAIKLLAVLLDERVDMVVGDRVSSGAYEAQNRRRFHGVGNAVMSWIVSSCARHHFNDTLSGLRVVSRPLGRCLEMRSKGFQIEAEFSLTAAYLGAQIREIPISYNQRLEGSTSKLRTFHDGWRILKFALSSFATYYPVPAFAMAAAMSSILGIFWGGRALIYYIEHGDMPYSATAIAAIGFGILSFQLAFSGIMLGLRQADSRHQGVTKFREMKQIWNTKLDAQI